MLIFSLVLVLCCATTSRTAEESANTSTQAAKQPVATKEKISRPHLPMLKKAFALPSNKVADMTTVTINGDSIVVNSKKVVSLSQPGLIDKEDLSGGYLVDQLYEAVSQTKKKSSALLSVENNIPFHTLKKILYTLGQARYSEFYFLVQAETTIPLQTERKGLPVKINTTDNDAYKITSRYYTDKPEVKVVSQADVGPYLESLEAGCAIQFVNGHKSFAQIMEVSDVLLSNNIQDIIFVEEIVVAADIKSTDEDNHSSDGQKHEDEINDGKRFGEEDGKIGEPVAIKDSESPAKSTQQTERQGETSSAAEGEENKVGNESGSTVKSTEQIEFQGDVLPVVVLRTPTLYRGPSSSSWECKHWFTEY